MVFVSHACRLCGQSRLRKSFAVQTWTIASCNHCQFAQVLEQPSIDNLLTIYDEAYFSSSKYRDDVVLCRENQRRLRLIQKFLPAGSRLLEAGCGSGEFINLAKNTYQMSGFDLSASGIALARQRNPELTQYLSAGSVGDHVLTPELYDGVCTWDMIEHLWNPVQDYRRLMLSIRPGGYLFLSTPNVGAAIARLMQRYWAFMTPPEHLSFFNHRSMTYFAKECLSADLTNWKTQGKWVNTGFVLYKLKRVISWLPDALITASQQSWATKLRIYVPTGDIQYVVIRKQE